MLESLQRALAHLRAMFRDPDLPPDPSAPVRQPRGYQPGGRQSSVAVEEPQEDEVAQAIGSRNHR